MADTKPLVTLRRSRDAMERKRASCPGWVWSCLCRDGGDWIEVAVPDRVYRSRCRACGIVATT